MFDFYFICPETDEFDGGEGVPQALPDIADCVISYAKDEAEQILLDKKKGNPSQGYLLMQAIDWAAPTPVSGIFKVKKTKSFYN